MTTKLVIDRQRWLRGEGGGSSALLRASDCKMCCLGFYCLQYGLTEEEIINKSSPQELSSGLDEPNGWLLDLVVVPDDFDVSPYDSEICNLLTTANDAIIGESESVTSEFDREQQIKRYFEDLGVEVMFI